MKFIKKLLCSIVLLALIGITLLDLFPLESRHQERGKFSYEMVASSLPFHPEWEPRLLTLVESREVEQALSQDYHSLGGGGQCIAFESADGKYVIKLLKQRKFAIPNWIERFPVPFLVDWLREQKIKKREERRHKVFSAFVLSFNHLADETGLLYVHLNPTEHLKKTLVFSDAGGNAHELELDPLEFVIQKKATLAFQTIDSLVLGSKVEEAKQAIDRLLTLERNFYEKGFRNRDPNFKHNYGFVGTDPILIDVGRIIPADGKSKKNFPVVSRFRKFLSDRHPELVAYFDQSVARILPSD